EMSESPALALRRKPQASIRVAADAVKDGRADALFSAGHTGASVMAAHAAFGLLQGVDRPALATIIPTRRSPAVLLDAGATVGCRPPHLVQFAVMGSAYARVALNGLCIVGHGASSAKAVANAVTMCVRAVNEDLLGRLSRDVARVAALPETPHLEHR